MEVYRALYRKWRPLRFSEVIGQSHITDTLRNEIISGRIAHAYLFCGTRGTGKTTVAKILSRAVNCEQPLASGDPCNECSSCRGILNGTILDVSEIDAASNNGVDNVREIRDEVLYPPSQVKYRVYIIDEVHMLSSSAFNALLKTLEEPPGHAIFILATTELQKVPATVRSRCQRFDFRRITAGDIVKRLSDVCRADNIPADSSALYKIAALSDGSMRDALSLLDQCATSSNEITSDVVAEVCGGASSDHLFALSDSIINAEKGSAISILNEILLSGKDIVHLAENLLSHFRDLLVAANVENPANILEIPPDELKKYKDQCTKVKNSQIIYIVRELSEALSLLRGAKNPRVLLEASLVKLCDPVLSDSPDALLARIERLERTGTSRPEHPISLVIEPPVERNVEKPSVSPVEMEIPSNNAKNEKLAGTPSVEKSALKGENSESSEVVLNRLRKAKPEYRNCLIGASEKISNGCLIIIQPKRAFLNVLKNYKAQLEECAGMPVHIAANDEDVPSSEEKAPPLPMPSESNDVATPPATSTIIKEPPETANPYAHLEKVLGDKFILE